MKQKKVFMIPWHSGHQYGLFKIFHKLGYEVDLCINYYRRWDEETRPLPKYVHFVNYYESGKYNLAILHVDQQLTDSSYGKTKLFKQMRDIIDCPVIIINHGTPHWEERFTKDEIIAAIKVLVKNDFMIVNSYKAAEEWTFGHPIIHGYERNEFKPLDKEVRIITGLSPAGLERYYNRLLLMGVRDNLAEMGLDLIHLRVDHTPEGGYEGYKEYIARSLIYFDPSIHTPMNRARTEAMLSGCCLVQTKGCQDEKRFLVNNKNCFLVPNNPKAAADKINELVGNYQRCIEVGKQGRKDMIKYADWDRYVSDWEQVINKVAK